MLIGTYLGFLILTLVLAAPDIAHEQTLNIQTNQITPEQAAGFLLGAQKSSSLPIIPEVLERIAACESGGRQYDDNGKPVLGFNGQDIGKYQINVASWGTEAKKLGIDLSTEEGNEAMAMILYHRYDTKPWRSSEHCWSRSS